MESFDIAFPNLGIYLSNVPKNFTVFGVTIALYGVVIALGMALAVTLVNYEGNRMGMPKDFWWDNAVFIILFGIVGARIYYVIFSWKDYKDNLMQVFNLRGGGLAIYGGVIAGFATVFVICRIKKTSYIQAMDAVVLGLLVGQTMGRWGNFFNRECFGEYTDSLLAMRLPIEMVRQHEITDAMWAHVGEGVNYIQVHPTFLYESGLNLCLLIVLLLYRRHKKFNGEIALGYIGGYGLIRFFVEGMRTDQLKFPGTDLAVSQCLGLACFVAAFITAVICHVRFRKKAQESEKKPE
ncbi:MAG: prolipoprotein diacylglyceryl transferase [Lachnospiraceae bacterium]|nr:prolipoprotein diacylglyceryl transferase [Lachnospiraceae bacterium]